MDTGAAIHGLGWLIASLFRQSTHRDITVPPLPPPIATRTIPVVFIEVAQDATATTTTTSEPIAVPPFDFPLFYIALALMSLVLNIVLLSFFARMLHAIRTSDAKEAWWKTEAARARRSFEEKVEAQKEMMETWLLMKEKELQQQQDARELEWEGILLVNDIELEETLIAARAECDDSLLSYDLRRQGMQNARRAKLEADFNQRRSVLEKEFQVKKADCAAQLRAAKAGYETQLREQAKAHQAQLKIRKMTVDTDSKKAPSTLLGEPATSGPKSPVKKTEDAAVARKSKPPISIFAPKKKAPVKRPEPMPPKTTSSQPEAQDPSVEAAKEAPKAQEIKPQLQEMQSQKTEEKELSERDMFYASAVRRKTKIVQTLRAVPNDD
ncbi:hypothetical protein PRZ48_002494 [Zasmidium cellare]|uniref:Uncharacterized protein n=1 Tax=Zasmidium cellare TaxID=395010 RepID=A0ABR0F6G3_ZASCE|nr:hypothetical protein PRZ48_002494 [Zasmidium cellare]